ncbi:MAG: carbohydrate kinase family protein [Hydrogenophilales bacterium]
MKTIIFGSIAYDNLMNFNGKFSDSILPEEISNLNVSFLLPNLKREFGGCAANIAYNLKLLNDNHTIYGSIGGLDCEPFLKKFKSLKIDLSGVKVIDDKYTAQAYIVTDNDKNQITLFHPGAMNEAHLCEFKPQEKENYLAIVSPNGKDAMHKFTNLLHKEKIDFIFDPGQGLPMFSKEELEDLIFKSNYLFLNEYEAKLLESKLKTPIKTLSKYVNFIVVTLGINGSKIYKNNDEMLVNAVRTEKALDPTGCGDAYRAGFLFSIKKNYSLEKSAKLSSIIAKFKVESIGPQNHFFDFDTLQKEYEAIYNDNL